MHSISFLPRTAGGVFLLLTSCLGVVGCANRVIPEVVVANAIAVGGNWQIASTDAAAGKLPMLSGVLAGSSAAMTGVLHSHSVIDCVAPTTAINVSGSADAKNVATLTGEGVAGGTLSITGTLAADGKSLTNASYTVVGGSCAFAARAQAIASAYSPITGTYTGGFSDSGGQIVSIVASLTQNPSSDASGNFQLSGSATFPNNPCFASPVSISNSLVTGGSFNLTYTDTVTTNSVTASGTFSTDGKALNVTNWTLTGPCGPDSGTGSLTRP